jgi:lysozyme
LLLANDIAEKTAQVLEALPWAARLSEPRLAVLINMAFQMGIRGLLRFKRMLGSVEDGQYDEAAMEMVDSLWAQQTPERAKRLAKQMLTGEWV